MMDPPIISKRLNITNIDNHKGNIMISSDRHTHPHHSRKRHPYIRPWTAADSNRCDCVLEVLAHDVMLGRGSGPNDHAGNIKFRDLVQARKTEYLSTNHRQTKASIAKEIVDRVYEQGGRFLKKLGPVMAVRMLPQALAESGLDEDAENDFIPPGAVEPLPRDVYQVQKHSVVMEKAKQALRQNQRSGSPSPTESPVSGGTSPMISSRYSPSMGSPNNKISSNPLPHGIVTSSCNTNDNNSKNNAVENNNFNTWTSVSIGNANIPTRLNACSLSPQGNSNSHNNSSNSNTNIGFHPNQNNHHQQQHQGGVFHGNAAQNNASLEPFLVPGSVFASSTQQQQHHQNEDSFRHQVFQTVHHQRQQTNDDPLFRTFQQQQDLIKEYQHQLNQNQQSSYLVEQRKKMIQEQMIQGQLEIDLRKEQVRQLQLQSMQKTVSSPPLYSNPKQDQHRHQPQSQPDQIQPQQSQQEHPHFLGGMATYTTTLDEMEGDRQESTTHRRGDASSGGAKETMLRASSSKRGGGALSSTDKHHDILSTKDDKSMMQMSAVMGSIKDMSVRSNEDSSMHTSSNDTIGTIDNITGGIVGGLSVAQMSGISILSLMNDSTDSLFRSSGRAKDHGAHNASWGAPEISKAVATSHAVTASLGIARKPSTQKLRRFDCAPGSGSHTNSKRSVAAAAGAAALGIKILANKNWLHGSEITVSQRRSSTPGNFTSVSNNNNNNTAIGVSALLAIASAESGSGGNELGVLQQHQQQQRSTSLSFCNNTNANHRNPARSAFAAHEAMINDATTAAIVSVATGNTGQNYRNLSNPMIAWRNGNTGTNNNDHD